MCRGVDVYRGLDIEVWRLTFCVWRTHQPQSQPSHLWGDWRLFIMGRPSLHHRTCGAIGGGDWWVAWRLTLGVRIGMKLKDGEW